MRNAVLAAVAVSVLVAPAYAQTTTTPSTSGPAAASAPGTGTGTGTSAKFVDVPNKAAMSEQLTDLDIYNSANEKVGEIEDIVINDKQIAGYVVSVGGFLGMGTRYVVVDPASIIFTYDESNMKWNAKMNISKDQVKAAPEYKYDAKHKS